ncbi:MAG TPA: carboxypeptidase-like regulatory domain-containing protein, partial [Planctomycetota bacterium]|nr:carboxypeptidase-like regulatory domain-containing protein [Planctomycetota bacterium]
VRTPGSAHLARGEIKGGIELRASPGGRVRGVVLGSDGAPTAGAAVTLRPGLNAFLGQITERKYRWLEGSTDAMGRFDLPGVPTGSGYVLSAAAPTIALEEQFGLEVRAGQVTEVTLRAHDGATITGVVHDGDGKPVGNANIALVYLDLTRVLFSADGRDQPISSDAGGRFRIDHVAAGRVAFIAATDGLAPSNIEERAVVDGGVYDDLELRLGEGVTVTGTVIDDRDQPLANARVEVRPFERPNDPQFLKLALKIRRVEVTSDADGRFVARGMSGERLFVQASKPGYTTAERIGVKLDQEIKIQLQRGALVRGKVLQPDGQPAVRFRVDTRTRPIPKDGKPDQPQVAADGGGQRQGWRMRMGGGRGDLGGERTVQLPEGQNMIDRGTNLDGNWREIASDDGTFLLTGLPPGRINVRVRADGFVDAAAQDVDVLPGQTSSALLFTLAAGIHASGTVVDAGTGRPVGDAQVTAYLQRAPSDNRRSGSPFDFKIDPEDFDFMALSSTQGRRSVVTDSHGRFRIDALEAGNYRFTARHPDMAKASAKDVELLAEHPAENIEIRLDAGGGVEGNVTGLGQRPLADALIVAFSLQAGSMKSAATDKAGWYRIEGLPPGQFLVFKSRMDEHADNLPLELMSNMRLTTVTVKQGKFTKKDIHDETEDGVRVYGIVRESGKPVARALVTVLGTDKEGLFGMGVRGGASGDDGRYELTSIKPGSYLFQVSRFRDRPLQTTFPVEVAAEARELHFDIDLPTSEVSGRVQDSSGAPVQGIQVSLGSDHGGLGQSEGLLGMIAQGGFGQARTDQNGEFRLRSIAAGTYRLAVSNRFGGRRGGNGGGDADKYGEAALDNLVVDGSTPVQGLLVTVPLAGRIAGSVVDGAGNPVSGAEIHYDNQDRHTRSGQRNPLQDLFGMQQRPVVTGADGRFEVTGLTPGVYDLRADAQALDTGRQNDVRVAEDAVATVQLRVVRGATLKVRATNVDKQQIPLASISLLDGQGKAVVNKISTLTVMRRLMGSADKVDDTGWYEFGSVPPDTYTLVVKEPGKDELRIVRAIADGETVAWDIDVAAELAARDGKKE